VRRLVAFSFIILLAGIVMASQQTKVTGILVDNACSARVNGDVEKAKAHTVKCALMPNCEKSGFALVTTDGKTYKLDEEGNKKASELLHSTKAEKGVTVDVEGTLKGETREVKSISEAK
jgi:hypothetical protein